MKTLTTTIILFIFSTSLYAADSYLCITEQSSGIAYNEKNKKWEPLIYGVGEKLIVKRSEKKNFKWKVVLHKNNEFWSLCKNDFNKYSAISCDGFFDFRMNKKTMKFKAFNIDGYTEDSKFANKFNLYINIGKCSAL